MGGVVLFMALELSSSISNCTTILHEYASNTHVGCITIYIEELLNVGLSQYRCSGEKLLKSEKCLFTLQTPFELGILL
jgi:hypothetical protein